MSETSPGYVKSYLTSALRLAAVFEALERGRVVHDDALNSLYQIIKSGSGASVMAAMPSPIGIKSFNLGDFHELDGTALADFADGVSTTPGYDFTGSEAGGIRWNDSATPDPIATSFVVPPEMDVSVNAKLYFLASKTGATVGDAVTWTCTVFNQVVGALYDADADYGGASDAMDGDATAKTVQINSLTLATANLAAYPANMTFSVQPTDGTLGTDDVILHAVWLEYTRKQGAAYA